MTNNTFYIYQNYYNNTVLGDKRYNSTDSTFVLKKVLLSTYSCIKMLSHPFDEVTFLQTKRLLHYICHILTYICCVPT